MKLVFFTKPLGFTKPLLAVCGGGSSMLERLLQLWGGAFQRRGRFEAVSEGKRYGTTQEDSLS